MCVYVPLSIYLNMFVKANEKKTKFIYCSVCVCVTKILVHIIFNQVKQCIKGQTFFNSSIQMSLFAECVQNPGPLTPVGLKFEKLAI